MHSIEGEFGPEPDTISFYEFKEQLALPPLANSKAVTQTLEALHNSKDADDLPGRERLIDAQNHLVDPLNYLEEKEGYSLSLVERKKRSSPTKNRPSKTRPTAAA